MIYAKQQNTFLAFHDFLMEDSITSNPGNNRLFCLNSEFNKAHQTHRKIILGQGHGKMEMYFCLCKKSSSERKISHQSTNDTYGLASFQIRPLDSRHSQTHYRFWSLESRPLLDTPKYPLKARMWHWEKKCRERNKTNN